MATEDDTPSGKLARIVRRQNGICALRPNRAMGCRPPRDRSYGFHAYTVLFIARLLSTA